MIVWWSGEVQVTVKSQSELDIDGHETCIPLRSQGAIFVYRSSRGSTGLSLSQTILSPAAGSSRGFGMKLSNPDPGTRASGISWRADGIAVSSPETGEAWYYRLGPDDKDYSLNSLSYRTRDLIRINDQSSVSVQPTTINFK